MLSEAVRTLGALRDLVTGLPERLRVALLRMKPNAASMKKQLVKMMIELKSEAVELVNKAVLIASRTAEGLFFAFGGILGSAVTMTEEATIAAKNFAKALPQKGAQMLVIIRAVFTAVKDQMMDDTTSPCGAFMRQAKSAYLSFQSMKTVAPVMLDETKALVFTFIDAANLVGGALANLPKGTSATQLVGYAKGVVAAGKVARGNVGMGLKVAGTRLRDLNSTCVNVVYPNGVPDGADVMDLTCYKVREKERGQSYA